MPINIQEAINMLEGRPASSAQVSVGFDHYSTPKPESKAAVKMLQQQQAILDCNDSRLADLINDLGGELVCARLYAAQWLACCDRMNDVRLVAK